MKLAKLTFFALLAAGMMACGNSGDSGEAENTENTETTAGETEPADEPAIYNISTADSKLEWEGKMVSVYAHTGTLDFKSGSLTMKEGKITGGEFTVDMTSIKPTDDNFGPDKPKEKLVGHLKSPDFFMVDTFPTAGFVIKSVDGNTITGDLTVRGVTSEEKVTDVVVEETENGVKATGNLTFDRQKYNVSYKNTMGDMVISNDIKTSITIAASKANS